MYKHREKVSCSRTEIGKRKQLAQTFPNDHLFVAVDGMDNSKGGLAGTILDSVLSRYKRGGVNV